MSILVDHAIAINLAWQGAKMVENRLVFLTDGAFFFRELPVGGIILKRSPKRSASR